MSLVSFLILLRYAGTPVAFICYLAYQLLIAKKKWLELKSDAIVMAVFAIIYYAFLYFCTS